MLISLVCHFTKVATGQFRQYSHGQNTYQGPRSQTAQSHNGQIGKNSQAVHRPGSNKQLTKIVQETACQTHADNGKPARTLQGHHAAEAHEASCQTVGHDRRTASQQGAYGYTQYQYQHCIPPWQGVKGDNRDDIGQAQLGTGSQEGHRNHAFEEEEGQGEGDEKGKVN